MRRRAVNALLGERKAGKTHVVADLVRAVLDGRRFLGTYPVNLPTGTEVVLFDTEMDPDDLHEMYTENGTENIARLRLASVRGVENRFDVRLDPVRDYWRGRIAPGSLLILDCLYSLLFRLGIDESSPEAGGLIIALRALAVECDAAGLLVAHHLGKDTAKGARGHSSIEGSIDARWTVELDGPPAADTSRIFSAYGRSKVSADAAVLALSGGGRLTVSGNRPQADHAAARRRAHQTGTWELFRDNPGLSGTGLARLPREFRGRIPRDAIHDCIPRLELINAIGNRGSRTRPEWHAVDGADPLGPPPSVGDEFAADMPEASG